jgi:hypothetical protein
VRRSVQSVGFSSVLSRIPSAAVSTSTRRGLLPPSWPPHRRIFVRARVASRAVLLAFPPPGEESTLVAGELRQAGGEHEGGQDLVRVDVDIDGELQQPRGDGGVSRAECEITLVQTSEAESGQQREAGEEVVPLWISDPRSLFALMVTSVSVVTCPIASDRGALQRVVGSVWERQEAEASEMTTAMQRRRQMRWMDSAKDSEFHPATAWTDGESGQSGCVQSSARCT